MTAPMKQANELVERVASIIGDRIEELYGIAVKKSDMDALAQAAIDAIFCEDTPALAARLISDLDTDESESPVDYRPGDYKPRVEVAKYVIGRIRGEGR